MKMIYILSIYLILLFHTGFHVFEVNISLEILRLLLGICDVIQMSVIKML